jgi:hypothetical protein
MDLEVSFLQAAQTNNVCELRRLIYLGVNKDTAESQGVRPIV